MDKVDLKCSMQLVTRKGKNKVDEKSWKAMEKGESCVESSPMYMMIKWSHTVTMFRISVSICWK